MSQQQPKYRVFTPCVEPPRGYAALHRIEEQRRREAADGIRGASSVPAPGPKPSQQQQPRSQPQSQVQSQIRPPAQQQSRPVPSAQGNHVEPVGRRARNDQLTGLLQLNPQYDPFHQPNPDKALSRPIDLPAPEPIYPPHRNPLYEGPQQEWKSSVKYIPEPKPEARPHDSVIEGKKVVGYRPIDNTRAGITSAQVSRPYTGIARIEPPVTRSLEDIPVGKVHIPLPRRDPLLDGDIHEGERRGIRPAAEIPGASRKSEEYELNPYSAGVRKILQPEEPATSGLPASVYRQSEPKPHYKPVEAIARDEGGLKCLQDHEDVLRYQYAGELNPPSAQLMQPDPYKPTSGLPPPSEPVVHRPMRRPASACTLSSNFFAPPAPRPTPAYPQAPAGMAAVSHEIMRTRQLYEMNKSRCFTDSGRPY